MTPSTATATAVHPHHSHYGHSHYQNYQTSAIQSPLESALSSSGRFGQTYTSYPSIPTSNSNRTTTNSSRQPLTSTSKPSPAQSTTNSANMSRAKSKRQPDWNEFYRNGVPEEIIVIDDTPPPQAPSKPSGRMGNTQSKAAQPQTNSTAQPANKKRRTEQGQSAANNSNDHITPQYIASDSNTQSLDRTTSIHTTAPTSLGSHGSIGASGYNDTQPIGQKRKRVTRQTTSSDKKRNEKEEALTSYIPPRKPPIKATDVNVRQVREQIRDPHMQIDDSDGHFIVNERTDLSERYQIFKLLGQGTFGKVVEAFDRRRRTKCAIKIIRSVQKYRDASRIELRVLSTLAQNDAENRNKCIHLRDCFDFRNHICIVTDLLGQSVFDFLKANSFVPFPSSQIQSFARQLLTSVAFLHDLNLIHTDLKPENILLVNNSYQTFTYNKAIPSSSTATRRSAHQRRVLLDTDIRLIDFGSATFDDEYHSTVVSTRHYRAPEIILQLGWSYACDIWSVGCILVEFFTGDALFQTHDNLEHLAMMEAVCGTKIDTRIVRAVSSGGRGSNSAAKFFRATKLDYPSKETTKASKSYVKAMKKLGDIIPATHNNSTFNKQFLDLLKKIFVYDPNKRITAKDALKHPWFNEGLIDDGTEAIRIRNERQAAQLRQEHAQQPQQTPSNGYR